MTAEDPTADYERFVRDHAPTLRRFARWSCLATPVSAEDVQGEVHLRLLADWSTVRGRPERQVLDHALRLTMDVARTMKRTTFRDRRREIPGGHGADLAGRAARDETASRGFERVEQALELTPLLARLEELERQVMVLRALGRTFAESSSILGRTSSQVRGAFYRGRRKLEDARGGTGEERTR